MRRATNRKGAWKVCVRVVPFPCPFFHHPWALSFRGMGRIRSRGSGEECEGSAPWLISGHLPVGGVPPFPTTLAAILLCCAPPLKLFQQDLHFIPTGRSQFLMDFSPM